MLFDEKELNFLDNNDSRTYFKEILQSYYSQNYRATIVLLYSFVIYDLFIKLQTMANEGDIVVLAGKGQETYQILASGKIHFDEREVVAEILSGKSEVI